MTLLDQCSWTEVSRGVMCRERKGMMLRRGKRQVSGGCTWRSKSVSKVCVGRSTLLSQIPLDIWVSLWGNADAGFYTDYIGEGTL